jgi:hypothetical protein
MRHSLRNPLQCRRGVGGVNDDPAVAGQHGTQDPTQGGIGGDYQDLR